ncbi:KpsF/GutQ family sugar-phosphate isomerase [Aliiroseovarius sp. PTFE2010]|uniref:KpsF/GutQ family sugar-phosphate isomerase n=1 Tax=Aliiroseovarius sp. PTFE2010 TaxID=3417190 RepID=UPI003CE8A8BC
MPRPIIQSPHDTVDAADPESLEEVAFGVVQNEADAMLRFAANRDPALISAIRLIHASTGPLIVAGIGKSGHIAHKIASTFRSLGKRAAFLHAAEASHGDLGIIHDDSVILCLSNSGETSELSDLLHYCRAHGNPVIAMTSSADSTLGQFADIPIAYGKFREACRNGLAPTTTSTLSLAIGDALAVGVSHLMNVMPEDFRRYHPGGKLGTRLLRVEDVMRKGDDLPIVAPDTPMSEVVITITQKALGAAMVMDGDELIGIITDGDMRRNLPNLIHASAADVATADPVSIDKSMLVSDALDVMGRLEISVMVVRDDAEGGYGLVHIHHCTSGLAK